MTSTFATPRIEAQQRPDGRLLLRSVEPLADHPVSVVHSFRADSEAHPEPLAAMTVGAPVVPASVAYSLQSHDHAKLRALPSSTRRTRPRACCSPAGSRRT